LAEAELVTETTSLVQLKFSGDLRGALYSLELPFPARRFFIVEAPERGSRRGGHAHRIAEQMLVPLEGNVVVHSFDGETRLSHFLLGGVKGAVFGLYVAPRVWLDLEFTRNARLLGIASAQYDEREYIRDVAELSGQAA
jgi:UDP-2-acetamido-3-amino-2,3-dideoxy-glucuronate N-acetyltransferase